MKRILIAISAFIGLAGLNVSFAANEQMQHQNHHQHAMSMMDTRTSLGLPEEMKQHQLSNMREHLEAVNSVISLMSENKFEDASKIAHSKLGSTPEMLKMCRMMGNENFTTLGLAFHKSGDDLGNVLKTKDVNASLRALNKTMQYCVECHATYRQ